MITAENNHEAVATFISLMKEATSSKWSFGQRLDGTEIIEMGFQLRPHLRIEINETGLYLGYRGLPVFKVEDKKNTQRILSILKNHIPEKHPWGVEKGKKLYFSIRKMVEEFYLTADL